MSGMIIRFDGGASPNPGPAVESDEWIEKESEFIGEATSNQAEYRALIAGLEESIANNPAYVTVKGDSQLIVKQVRGE
jgi:ribonuclease HI